MTEYNRIYGQGTGADIIIPHLQTGLDDFATSSEWTPAAGDVKISKDGAAAANIASLPTFVTDIGWKYTFSDAELQAKLISVTISDAALKDDHFSIITWGNASAMFPIDLSDGVRAGLTALPNAAADGAGGLPISDAGGLAMDDLLRLAILVQSGKTLETVLLDIWAAVAGNASANDASNPTSITYDSPDDTIQITHTLTSTARTVT